MHMGATKPAVPIPSSTSIRNSRGGNPLGDVREVGEREISQEQMINIIISKVLESLKEYLIRHMEMSKEEDLVHIMRG